VRAAGTEKALIEGLSLLSREPPQAGYVIIEAGDLKKGTGLRKVAEAGREIISVACYGDDVRAVNALIDQELALENLRITQAARLRLNDALGGDRMASRNEIRKLALYCRGAAVIEEEQVLEIVGDASAISVDDCIDAILKGDANALDRAIRKITASKTPIFLVLQASLKLFQLLDLMRSEMDEKGQPPAQAVATLGRHLHFRRKPLVETALKTWNAAAILRSFKAGRGKA
jgi:DNA polymerase III subunit delta